MKRVLSAFVLLGVLAGCGRAGGPAPAPVAPVQPPAASADAAPAVQPTPVEPAGTPSAPGGADKPDASPATAPAQAPAPADGPKVVLAAATADLTWTGEQLTVEVLKLKDADAYQGDGVLTLQVRPAGKDKVLTVLPIPGHVIRDLRLVDFDGNHHPYVVLTGRLEAVSDHMAWVSVYRYADGQLTKVGGAGGWMGSAWLEEADGQQVIKVSERVNIYNEYLPMELLCKPCARPFRTRTLAWQGGALKLIADETSRLAYELYNPRDWEKPLPPEAVAARDQGEALIGAGKVDDALKALQQAIALAPEYPDALSDLAYAYAQQGKWAESRDAARRAVDLNQWHAHANFNLGFALIALGQYKEAEMPLRVATGLQLDRWETHYQLGLCYEKQMNLAAADVEYKQALDLKPGDPEIKAARARIR